VHSTEPSAPPTVPTRPSTKPGCWLGAAVVVVLGAAVVGELVELGALGALDEPLEPEPVPEAADDVPPELVPPLGAELPDTDVPPPLPELVPPDDVPPELVVVPAVLAGALGPDDPTEPLLVLLVPSLDAGLPVAGTADDVGLEPEPSPDRPPVVVGPRPGARSDPASADRSLEDSSSLPPVVSGDRPDADSSSELRSLSVDGAALLSS
jgi:hypothetical protein